MKSEIRPFTVRLHRRIVRWFRAIVIVGVFFAGVAQSESSAEIVVTDRVSSVQVEGLVEKFEFGTFILTDQDDYFDKKELLTGLGPFNETASKPPASVPTGSASSTAKQNTSFSLSSAGDALLVTGTLVATADSTGVQQSATTGPTRADAFAISSFGFHFELTDTSYRYEIVVSPDASAVPAGDGLFFAAAQVELTGPSVEVRRREATQDPTPLSATVGSLTGILKPGPAYFVGVAAQTHARSGISRAHGESDADINFSISLIPVNTSRWIETNGGSFQGISNWSAAVPGALDVAVFDLPGTYKVTLEQDVTNKRLRANGAAVNVSFDLNGNEYVLDEISLGGLAGDSGRITFADSSGPVVSAASAFGDGPTPAAANSDPPPSLRAQLLKAGKGYTADVTIPISTTDGTIDATGRVYVDGKGVWEVTHLKLGEVDQGTLEVFAGGKVISNSAVVGKNLFSFNISDATVTGQGSVWDTQTLVVGERGLGHLKIEDKGIVTARDIVLGSIAGSFGRISVSGSASLLQNSTDKLTVGLAGGGTLGVNSGSRVAAGELTIGGSSTGENAVLVESAGLLEVFGLLTVGSAGGGTAKLTVDGGRVERKLLAGDFTFTSIGPKGELQVNAGHFYEHRLLNVNGEMRIHPTLGSASVGQSQVVTPGQLTIGPGGTLSGNGVIRVIGSKVTVRGGVDDFDDGKVLPSNSPGTLTIDGDYEQTGGLLGIEIAGTTPGQFDVLAVTGSAMLGGTLRLEFIDDFAPRQGDEFKFLDIGGALSGAFDEIEVRNLLPGFQFDVRSDGGGLTMVALNDGVFVPEPATLILLLAGALAMLPRNRARVS